jgi:hypothetical protein
MARRTRNALGLFMLCCTVAACGSSGAPATQSTTGPKTGRDVPPELTQARDARSCESLPDDQACTSYDHIETWFGDGTLQANHVAGAVALVQTGCVTCHTYRDIGTQNLGAPDLTHEGTTSNEAKITRVIVCPKCVTPGSSMPPFTLSKSSVDALASFLASSR